MKVTNTSVGPRGLHTLGGFVLVEPGETVEVDMTKGEAESAKGTGHFDMTGAAKAEPKGDDKA